MGLSLDRINHDVLVQIVHYVNDLPYDDIYSQKNQSTLKALSLTCKRLREECLPFLFKRLFVSGDWTHTLGRLEEMEVFLTASTYVRAFRFDVSVGDVFAKNYNGMKHLARSLPRQLATTLSKMPQLEELVLAIPEEGHLDVFEKQFKEANLILPDVHTLVLSRACEFVVQLCPNVRRISSKESKGRQPDRTKHSIMLLEAAAKATKLTRFGMVEAWDVAFTEVLLSTLPHVRWLDLEPSLGGCDPILKLIPVLSRFPNLQHLGLADAILLGVGFNPPWCGNAYDGPDGAKVLEWVLKEQVEVEELVAKTAGAACSRLLDEWIGRRTLLSIVRDAKGNCVDVVRQAFDEPQKAIGIFWRFHP